MAKRIKIGDVVEIPTSKGFSYAQYTHEKERWGSLIRVLEGFFQARPTAFSELVKQKQVFVTFFPLQAAVSKRVFVIAGHEEVPPDARPFPLFRAAGHVDRQGRVQSWWLWDGERERKIEELTESQMALPIRAVWNDTLLIQRIEEGWSPTSDRR